MRETICHGAQAFGLSASFSPVGGHHRTIGMWWSEHCFAAPNWYIISAEKIGCPFAPSIGSARWVDIEAESSDSLDTRCATTRIGENGIMHGHR